MVALFTALLIQLLVLAQLPRSIHSRLLSGECGLLDSCYLENLTDGRKTTLSTTESNMYQYIDGEEYSILCEVVDGPVQSVVFTYDGQTHTERKVPYYMKGDWKGWINRVEYLQQCGKREVQVTAKSKSTLCFDVKLELVARCEDEESAAPIAAVTEAPTQQPVTITPTSFPTEQMTESPSANPTEQMTTPSPTSHSTDQPTATFTTMHPSMTSTSLSPSMATTTFHPTSASTTSAPTTTKTAAPTVTVSRPVSTPPVTEVTRSPTAIPILETGAPTDQCANIGELCGTTPCGLIWCCGDLVCKTSKTGFRCAEDCSEENWFCRKDDDCCGDMECRPVPNRWSENRCYTKTAAPIVMSPTAAPTSSPTTYCEEKFGVSSNDPRCPGGSDRSNYHCPLGLTCYYNGITWPGDRTFCSPGKIIVCKIWEGIPRDSPDFYLAEPEWITEYDASKDC